MGLFFLALHWLNVIQNMTTRAGIVIRFARTLAGHLCGVITHEQVVVGTNEVTHQVGAITVTIVRVTLIGAIGKMGVTLITGLVKDVLEKVFTGIAISSFGALIIL